MTTPRNPDISSHPKLISKLTHSTTIILIHTTTMPTSTDPEPAPPLFNYILGFLLIGIAWGFTTPFIRRAARTHSPPAHPILSSPSVTNSSLKSKIYGAFFGVVDLLRNPRYAIPLVINLTGSIWFFLLIGKAGEFDDFLCLYPISKKASEDQSVRGRVDRRRCCAWEAIVILIRDTS